MPNEFSEALSIHEDAAERVLLSAIPRGHILPSEEGWLQPYQYFLVGSCLSRGYLQLDCFLSRQGLNVYPWLAVNLLYGSG